MKKCISFLLFFAVSCNSTPKNVLLPSQMQSVLWDVMQADEMADYYSGKDSSFKTMKKHIAYYQTIFSIHNTTKTIFVNSLNYYESHPEKFKKIVDSLQSYSERLQNVDTIKKTKIDTSKTKSHFQ